MSIIVDTHAHIDLPDFDDDREDVVRRAGQLGIAAIIAIGFNPDRWRSTAELSNAFPNVRRAVGLHPNDASTWSDGMLTSLRQELLAPDVVALGEIGLDFYRHHASTAEQRRCFIDQLHLAQEADLPVVIHQRAAEADLLGILRPFAPLRGVLHCFSSDGAFAEACLELGLHLGIGGVFTYPKSGEVRVALANVPVDRLLLETDAPYLAPQGHRGKRNEPAFVRMVAERLASERGMSVDALSSVTTENAIELFGERLADAVRSGVGEPV